MRGSETRVGGPLSPRSVGPVGNEKPWTSLLHFKVDIKPVTRAAPPVLVARPERLLHPSCHSASGNWMLMLWMYPA